MDKDLITLMQILSQKSFVTLSDIQHLAHMTKRQASYRIEKLNELLKSKHVPPIIVKSSSKNSLQISPETRKEILAFINEADTVQSYYFNRKERSIYIYLMLFMNEEYISLYHFISALQVSRSTVLHDIKELNQTLEEQSVAILNNRQRGYYLSGDESELRRRMMKFVIYTLSEEQNSQIFDIFIENHTLESFSEAKVRIKELAEKHQIHFVDDRLTEFIYIFSFLRARLQNGISSSLYLDKPVEFETMSTMKEYAFCIDLLNHYDETMNEADIYYITAWILGISFGNIYEDTKDCVFISEMVGKIMARFGYLSGTQYANKEDIFIQLYAHFRPAYYRLLFKLPIINPLYERIKEEYKELFQLVQETMKPFQIIFGQSIPDDEIAYLTMHFATIYKTKSEYIKTKPKKALVVCSSGIGSSAILYNELTNMFPELYFFPPTDTAHINSYKHKVDIIFSTNYISRTTIDTKIPVILVNPVMSIGERYQVFKEVYSYMGSAVFKQYNIEQLLELIKKYATIHDIHSLYNELSAYFIEMDTNQKTDIQLHLLNLVHENIIQLQIEAEDWQQAIRIAYEPMVQNHYITQNYVEQTIKHVKLTGPYIVITKHVALSHTYPEAGALSCALGITVLSTPVSFGNTDNDPVRYIFSLSAIDNKQHLAAMSELVELLNNKDFYTMLDQARYPHEVIQYLEEALHH